jgi:predicted TIM-barrel fold metal-dependent hydrolase
MFSTDYPYGSTAPAAEFLHSIPATPVDRERIAHRNADQLLRL